MGLCLTVVKSQRIFAQDDYITMVANITDLVRILFQALPEVKRATAWKWTAT